MFKELKDKIIIVTGSNGLIGKEVVKKLISNNATVISADINDDLSLDNFFNCDITKEDDIDKLISHLVSNYGRIDGLVNLAYPRTSDWGEHFENVSLDSWRKNIDMQLNSTFYLCQQILKVMQEQKSGSIVNIGSIYGVVGNDFSLYEDFGGTSPAAYAAVKGGIVNLTRYLASYYGPYNVRINCVSPGGVLDESKQHPSFIKKYSNKSLLKRLGKPEEMAGPISFLLSDEASFITGHNLMVDGGWTAI